jgi:predicted SprT family Zn-dependent metalloprotease
MGTPASDQAVAERRFTRCSTCHLDTIQERRPTDVTLPAEAERWRCLDCGTDLVRLVPAR